MNPVIHIRILVTILILIDGFLQLSINKERFLKLLSHNPYFNRWFSAINKLGMLVHIKVKSQSLF